MIKFGYVNRKNGKLSNFYQCPIEYDGFIYSSSEAIYQSHKSLDRTEWEKFTEYDALTSKKKGRKLVIRDDWEDVKYDLMVSVVYAKFTQNEDLKEFLLSTEDEDLMEDTTGWHDNIWGNCECEKCKDIPGQNLLGKALIEVRDKIRREM